MQIAFRVDSSSKIGIGHLIRCRSLAIHLKKQDHQITFFCKNHFGNSNYLIKNEGFQLIELKAGKNKNLKNSYGNWLGSSQIEDASQVINSSNKDFHWIIVDHYGITKKWHKIIKGKIKNILVIDDIASRSYDCNMILNQNFNLNYRKLYQGKVSKETKLFLGPQYTILDPDYIKIKKNKNIKNTVTKSVFVYFGGEDHFNLSKITVLALGMKEIRHLKIKMVLPQKVNERTKTNLISISKKRGKVELISPKRSLADTMSGCDIAIGAGGSTLWERIHLELPSIIISTAKNQEIACKSLANKKIIDYLGNAENINKDKISDAVLNLILCKKNFNLKKMRSKKLKIGSKLSEITRLIK